MATYVDIIGPDGSRATVTSKVARLLRGKGYRLADASEPPEPTDASAEVGSRGPETPPTGSVGEVLAWVGDDPVRAQAALDAEQERPKPRKSLVEALEPLLAREAG